MLGCWGAGREFECDYGYVGEDGICVDYTPEAVAPSGPDCGMTGQPACNGVDLDGSCSPH